MNQWWVVALAFLSRFLFAPIVRMWVRRGAKREVKAEILVETLVKDAEKQEKARVASYKEKRDADGLSDSDLIDRLRRRGDDWGRL